jgi:hypothetical protein
MNDPLVELIAAAPWWRRHAMRVLLALARRPRGLGLLRLLSPSDQVAHGLLALGRYDDPARAVALGWDAEAVTARGRALREAEGRP